VNRFAAHDPEAFEEMGGYDGYGDELRSRADRARKEARENPPRLPKQTDDRYDPHDVREWHESRDPSIDPYERGRGER
jgi:hypothetical protein